MPRNKFLPYFLPTIGEDEIEEVIKTLKSGWITTGEKSHKFENNFSSYLNAKSALALNSCTAALHLALLLLDIKPGDEIITTPFSFVATSNVIEYLNAKPIFVDIEKETLNIDPKKILEKIDHKTKAILIVHYGGHACDMDNIINISSTYQIPIIEDVAHGIGGTYKNKYLGTFGKLGAFSFYANKNITTIEGGMLVGEENLIEKARIMSLHGIDRDAWKRYRQDGNWFYEVIYPGLKYNMTDVSASIGLHQLRKLHTFQQLRSKIAKKYNQSFLRISNLEIPTHRENITHTWFNYPLRLHLEKIRINRNTFIEELKKLNIGSSVHFIPIHMHPYYKNKYNFKPEDFPIAYSEYERIINLPIYPAMSDKDIDDVIEAVINVASQNA